MREVECRCIEIKQTRRYCICRLGKVLFPPVDADAGAHKAKANVATKTAADDDDSSADEDADGQLKKARAKKAEKVGFRERKVRVDCSH